ncbi:MAG: hypothetical protein LBC18_09920, partial [Opitutaceae bacterium]|nr:hypothetical protein [Opitutaceae bacterium]
MRTEALEKLHPEGEGDFEEDLVFATAGGQVALRVGGETLTPYGGLVPWAAFVRRADVFEELARPCPVARTSNNAAPAPDILHSFALTALCAGTRFAHVQRLREDASPAGLFAMKRVV